jgi:hypothetical protein
MKIISSDKIDLLSGYLHDATFFMKDIKYSKEQDKLVIALCRIYYEEPKECKFLFFIPATKFKRVECELIINNITEINYEWREDAFNGPDDVHTLLSLEYDNHSLITIGTEYMDIKAQLPEFAGIILNDTSEPSKKYPVTDFSHPLGYEKLINELKG